MGNCEEEYLRKGIFTHNDRHHCQSPYLETKSKTGKFFPMRGIRCDGVEQCPRGDDKEGCQLPPEARYAMSLFIIIVTIIVIAVINIIISIIIIIIIIIFIIVIVISISINIIII